MLTTLLLSFGIPMLLGGDEMGRTQRPRPQAGWQLEIDTSERVPTAGPATARKAGDRVTVGPPLGRGAA